ncbi:MAG: divergent polysaccharide deacetylase family protein [Candidatus Omnitrophota bacterium]
MNNNNAYKIIIAALIILIIAQWIVIGKKPVKTRQLPVKQKLKIALVIDDWGYNANNLEIAEQIKFPLTASILPNLPYSRAMSEALHKAGYEIILHLPMESHDRLKLEENTILTSLPGDSIRTIVTQDIESLSHVKGVSNHMGSRATENSRTMGIIFNDLKKKKLYFLDSFVSSKSVCGPLARKLDLPFAKRDIFLDNESEKEYIKQQIYKLKKKADMYGQAIGIGHDRRTTLIVLKEIVPQLQKAGYEFVFVSDLVR